MRDEWCEHEPREAIAWLRPDPRALFAPVWRLSVTLVCLGALLCAYFFKAPFDERVWALGVGLLCVASGMTWVAVVGLRQLRDERCVAFLNVGVLVKVSAEVRLRVRWSELHALSVTIEAQSLRLTSPKGEVLELEMEGMPLSSSELSELLGELSRRHHLGVPLRVLEELERRGISSAHPH